MGKLEGMFRDDMLDALAREGKRVAAECEAERSYTHRTKNLKDSYGWGVYHGGKLQRHGFLTDSQEAREPRRIGGVDVQGRQEIMDYLLRYKPAAQYELVVYAAMPYASILEERKYRVISTAVRKLDEMGKPLGARTKNL